MNRGLEFLTIDVTHKCNLNCSFCGKMVWDSDYEITMEQVENFCKQCNDVPATCVRVSGGEPLTHPYIEEIIDMIAVRMKRVIHLATNGILLHKHESIIPKLNLIHITPYPGVNDAAVAKYGELPNVNLVTVREYYDPLYDPDLSIEAARYLYSHHCVRSMVSITSNRVYPCCLAEMLERTRGIDKVHIELKDGWMEKWESLNPLPACQHCLWG